MIEEQMSASVMGKLSHIREQGILGLQGEKLPVSPREHIRKLNKLRAQAGHSKEFCESFVAHTVLARINPRRSFSHFYKLRDKCLKDNEPERFAEFEEAVNSYLGEVSFTPHGFKGVRLEHADKAQLFDGVSQIMSVLDGLGHKSFVNAGTLLGLVRDGRPIDHDDDVDLAVVLKNRRDELAAKEWHDLHRKLNEAGVECEPAPGSWGVLKVPPVAGIQIDLFPSYGSKKHFSVYPYGRKKFAYSDIFPLKTCDVSGLRLPAKPVTLLEVNYGSKWTVPDPGFVLPWKKYKKEFKRFLRNVEQGPVLA